MVVREDVAVARDDEAGATRLLRARLLRLLLLVLELAEELLKARWDLSLSLVRLLLRRAAIRACA